MGIVNQFQQSAFANPQNGQPGDASVVLGNDNATRVKHNSHDADATIHLQTSDLASRPAAGTAGRPWMTTERRLYIDDGASWDELLVRAEDLIPGTATGNFVVDGDLNVTGNFDVTGMLTAGTLALTTLTVGAAPPAGNGLLRVDADAVDNISIQTDGEIIPGGHLYFDADDTHNIGILPTKGIDPQLFRRPANVAVGTGLSVGDDPGGIAGAVLAGLSIYSGPTLSQRTTYADGDYFVASDGTRKAFFGLVDASGDAAIELNTAAQNFSVFIPRTVPASAVIECLRLDTTSTLGATSLWVFDHSDAVIRRVEFGADDSGGAGYKLLRILN